MAWDCELKAMLPALSDLHAIKARYHAQYRCRQTDHGLMFWGTDDGFIFLAHFENARVAGLTLDRDYEVAVSHKRVYACGLADATDKYRFERVMLVLNKALDTAKGSPVAVTPEHMAIVADLFKAFDDRNLLEAASCYGGCEPFGMIFATRCGAGVSMANLFFVCAQPNLNNARSSLYGKQLNECQAVLMAINPPF